ncbi:MAG: rhomboid family intramembrane serine protease [Bacteroidota bacterium]|nr:rhomboid family intramembrane serine protease [Bacteroidota bacterium]
MEILDLVRFAPVSFYILLITVLISLASLYNEGIQQQLILHPYTLVKGQRPYSIISSGFIHGDFGHLIFNAISFYYFCPLVETAFASFTSYGHVLFAIMYVSGIIISDLVSVYRNQNNAGYFSLGASGAISAALFSSILLVPDIKVGIIFLPIPIPGPIFAILYVIFSIYSARSRRDNINHEAHLFGALYGLIFTLIAIPESIMIFRTYLAKYI